MTTNPDPRLSANEFLADRIVRHQLYLTRLQTQEARQLAKLLEEAIPDVVTRIERRLKHIETRGGDLGGRLEKEAQRPVGRPRRYAGRTLRTGQGAAEGQHDRHRTAGGRVPASTPSAGDTGAHRPLVAVKKPPHRGRDRKARSPVCRSGDGSKAWRQPKGRTSRRRSGWAWRRATLSTRSCSEFAAHRLCDIETALWLWVIGRLKPSPGRR